MIGASDDDLNVLLAKSFVFKFETGVCVIVHWKIHNYIQKDRYHETIYKQEKSKISEDENGTYIECIHDVSGDVSKMDTQVRLGKVSQGKSKVSIEGKNKYLDHVYLTEDEYTRLISDYGESETQRMIQKLDTYLEDHPEKRIDGKKPYHSHNKTMRTWANSDKKDQNVSTRKGTVIV
jgi:hypothetical protein